MSKAIQRNVGRCIARNFDIIEFLSHVWTIDTDDLPEDEVLSLPWPLRSEYWLSFSSPHTNC